MNSEFFTALELLEKEKGIPADYMIEKIEAALISAYKKEYGNNSNVRVVIDPEKKDVKLLQQKEVVEAVEDPETQISLEDAKKIAKKYKVGMTVEIDLKTKNFRRLSAAAAKSVIIQGIREGERRRAQEAYENKHEEIITAIVHRFDPDTGNVVVDTGAGYAVLPAQEQIPGELFHAGDQIKVFVQEVNRENRGPLVTLSRVHPGLIRRLFELEIPEIAEGVVIIKGVSREAGSRSKIAVYSRDPEVDPVGACIGARGARIGAIVDEVRGEKIDIVKYSETPEEYISAALAPAAIQSVVMTGDRTCRVYVDPDQLSLAIGKEGQNARLAARLTGCKIDIKADTGEGYDEAGTDEQ